MDWTWLLDFPLQKKIPGKMPGVSCFYMFLYHIWIYYIAMLAVHILLSPNSNGVYFATCNAWDFCPHFQRVADAGALVRDVLQPPSMAWGLGEVRGEMATSKLKQTWIQWLWRIHRLFQTNWVVNDYSTGYAGYAVCIPNMMGIYPAA